MFSYIKELFSDVFHAAFDNELTTIDVEEW